MRYYKVDPLEYNRKVDDALLLDDVLSPDPKLRRLLDDIDKTKVRLWLFTNAYITHGRRVVRLLGVDDVFEGITYCDYGARPFLCKPSPAMFEKAEREAGAQSKDQCYFIGNAITGEQNLNCSADTENRRFLIELPACPSSRLAHGPLSRARRLGAAINDLRVSCQLLRRVADRLSTVFQSSCSTVELIAVRN